MSSSISLSDALKTLLQSFEPHVDRKDGVELSQEAVASIVFRLRLLAKMGLALEQEVRVHRMVEVARNARVELGELSIEAFTHLVLDPEGKVVKPDFGRKK